MNKITNVLAERYASKDMKDIWSGEGRIVMERELWIAVMKAQKELGPAMSSRLYKQAMGILDKAAKTLKAGKREEAARFAGKLRQLKGLTPAFKAEMKERLGNLLLSS